MGAVAIRAEGLSKSYQIDHEALGGYRTIRESLGSLAGKSIGRTSKSNRETIWAVQDVSFEVRRGETLGIIGRNGAGKSTLMKILSRITRPTSGRAEVFGRLGSLLEVGTGFHPELTGRENIFLNGAILGMRRREIQRHFDEIVDFAETEQFLDTPVKRYSTGMYMRLAFAVAAHLETDILVVDEVLAVGDAAFQTKCLGKMANAAGQGRTILFVSHNMAAVRILCRAAMVLEGGRTEGPVDVERAILRYSTQRTINTELAALDRGDLSVSGFDVTQEGADLTEFDGGRPIDVRIKCRLARDLRDFRIGVVVRTEQGDTVTRCFLADWDRSRVDLPKGAYVLEGSIPGTFLAGGRYVVSVHASIFDVVDYDLEGALSRTILVTTPPGFNQAYPRETARHLTGVVVMDADWRITRA